MTTLRLPGYLEAIARLADDGLTDGLPVIPPTRELVREMLDLVHLDADTPIAEIAPLGKTATVELIAANAVMAGCLPVHFPVVLAAIEAVARPEFNLSALQTTTNPVAPLVIVNGPIRELAGYNSGVNALGPGSRANATTGRAINLVLRNIGGAVPGEVDMATHGYPGKYTFCFGENEERSPWDPLHVSRGFARDESCVTVTSAAGTVNMMGPERTPEDLLKKISGSIRIGGSNDHQIGHGSPLLVLSPEHARIFGAAGMSREELQKELVERSKLRLSALAPMAEEIARALRDPREIASGEVGIVDDPKELLIAVAGGEGVHTCFVMSFGDGKAVTAAIQRVRPS